MSKPVSVAIVGAGEIGTSALEHLLAHLPEARFVVFDDREEALAGAVRLDADRVVGRPVRLDPERRDALDGCDVVLNTAGPFYGGAGTVVAELALASGCRYLDICDDAEGVEALESLRPKAAETGQALITGAGMSPGLSNVWARRLIDAVPGADGIDIHWVVHEPLPGGLAALRHLLHMAIAPCTQFVDGAIVKAPGFVPETARTVRFPDPIGPAQVLNAPHPEPLTLPWTAPALNRVRCLGGLLPDWANSVFSSISRLGFGGADGGVEIDGREVDPAEVLWRVLWRRLEGRPQQDDSGYAGLQVVACAGDEPLAEISSYDGATMSRATGLGAAAILVESLAEELPSGLWGPETLDAERTLSIFGEMADRVGAFPVGRNLIQPVEPSVR